jgi:hypothetical protein
MWAAAPVSRGFKARVDRLNTSRSYMSYYISTVNVIVQERLLETGLLRCLFQGALLIGH